MHREASLVAPELHQLHAALWIFFTQGSKQGEDSPRRRQSTAVRTELGQWDRDDQYLLPRLVRFVRISNLQEIAADIKASFNSFLTSVIKDLRSDILYKLLAQG